MCVSYASKWGKKQQKIQGNQSSCDRYWKVQEKGLKTNSTRTHGKRTTTKLNENHTVRSVAGSSKWMGRNLAREARHTLKKIIKAAWEQ